MVCPYAVNRHVVQQTVYDYADDGNVKMSQVVEHDNAEFLECKIEQCGDWHDGRCWYYGNNS